MKRFTTYAAVSLALGTLGGAVVSALPLEAAVARSALWGVVLAALTGLVVLGVKAALVVPARTPTARLKRLLAGQTIGFLLRLLLVGVGAFAAARTGGSPAALAITFLSIYLGQQIVEVRYAMAAPRGPEVTT